MYPSIIIKFAPFRTAAVIGLASYASASLATSLTTDAQGNPIYVSFAGALPSIVSVAPSIPILVYNCYNIPLICENVMSFAKAINPSGNGLYSKLDRHHGWDKSY